MSDEQKQAREHEIREKIANQMKAIGQPHSKPLAGQELQKLKSAASRLDEILKASADADREALRSAAGRLDTLLRDLRRGNDVTARLKRRIKKNDSHTNEE